MFSTSSLITHFTALRIMCVLEKHGVWDMFRKYNGKINAHTLTESRSLDLGILLPLLDFLAVNIPEILKKREGEYHISAVFENKGMKNALYFMLAYEPVFLHLEELLCGEKTYGKEITRAGRYLRLSSALYNKQTWDIIEDIIIEHSDITTVVDLGCSAGDFLVRICNKHPKLSGIGIEIDSEVVRIAKKTIKDRNMTDQVSIIEGDVAKPDEWKKHIPKTKHVVFVGVTVWHEFLSGGTQNLLDIFARYRACFFGNMFIVAEYNAFSMEELASLEETQRGYASIYQLVHPLSLQGDPQSKESWRNIFRKGKIHIKEEINAPPNSTIYIGSL